MKLLVAVVRGHDIDRVLGALIAHGFHATLVDSHGSALGERNGSVFVGVQATYLANAITLIRSACQSGVRLVNTSTPVTEPVDTWAEEPLPVAAGGTSLLVFDLARYERIA
ncbi:MAG TPA: cyclic-di-AMP receptor [Thermomicrobiales bacterium]|nr:cyclic-di-AMP receptor [Thermomicrobiales bacterium]